MSDRARTTLVAILLAHVALTTWLSAVLNIWVDEAYTLHTTSLSLGGAAHQALTWEVQPPLYFVLLDIWRHLGFEASIFWARLFSVIAVALGVYVTSLVARSYLSERQGLWVTAAIAFNPFVIGCAVEARVYGLVFLWSALLMWLFHKGYCGEGDGKARAAFAIVGAAALYTQYYLGFLLVGFAAALIVRRQWRDLASYLAWMVVVGVIFLPVALYVRAEVTTNTTNFATTNGFLVNLVQAVGVLATDTLPLDWVSRVFRHAAYAVFALLIVFVVVRSDRYALARAVATPWAILIASAVLFVVAVTAAHMPVTSRYTTAFHLPAMIALYAVLCALPPPLDRPVTATFSIAIIVMSVFALAYEFRTLAKLGDWARVNAYIAAQESPNQRIVVFDAQSALPLSYYYRGPNQIVPLPHAISFDRYDLHDVALHNEAEVVRGLGYLPNAKGMQLWLVTSDGCRRVPIDFRCELLDNFVARHYDTMIDRHFTGSRVRLLRERT